MAFKVGSNSIIDDSGMTGLDIRGVAGKWGNDLSISAGAITPDRPLENWTTGYKLTFENTKQVIEIQAQETSYGQTQANVIEYFDHVDSSEKIQQIFFKVHGQSQRGGWGLSPIQKAYTTPSAFSGGSERQGMEKFDISDTTIPPNNSVQHWLFNHSIDNKLYNYKSTIPWAYTFSSNVDSYDHSGEFSFSDSNNAWGVRNLRWSEDGDKVFIHTKPGNTVYETGKTHQYSLSTPWDISTMTHDSSFYFRIPNTTIHDVTIDSIDSNNNDCLDIIDFHRSGTRVLVANKGPDEPSNDDNVAAVLKLDTAWDLTSTAKIESWGKYSINDHGDALQTRLDLDYKYIRMLYSSLSSTTVRSHRWNTPWHLYSTHDSSFTRESKSEGTFLNFFDFAYRPDGHRLFGLLPRTTNSRIYLYDTTDSANSPEIPSTFVLPANIKWEGGYQPDFPDSGENLYIELLSFDSGTSWYGKELYKG